VRVEGASQYPAEGQAVSENETRSFIAIVTAATANENHFDMPTLTTDIGGDLKANQQGSVYNSPTYNLGVSEHQDNSPIGLLATPKILSGK
jgi:hypothetical protein